jgi:hypothetical protein
MLTLNIPEKEFYNEKTETFFTISGGTLCLEHSLKAMSEWESKWKKPFISEKNKTVEEIVDYIKCMTINDVDPEVFVLLTNDMLIKVREYIDDPRTATTITDRSPKRGRREVITTELVYFWMVAQQVPIECENWNFNRLITLLQICAIKNNPGKKMSSREISEQYRAINAKRLGK